MARVAVALAAGWYPFLATQTYTPLSSTEERERERHCLTPGHLKRWSAPLSSTVLFPRLSPPSRDQVTEGGGRPSAEQVRNTSSPYPARVSDGGTVITGESGEIRDSL